MKKAFAKKRLFTSSGYGQLTLVEHSLCPLDPAVSLGENFVHDVSYVFTDRNRHSQLAHAKVICPLGLSAHDEFFLWGLLSLAVSQPSAEREFYATPHYCLRRLGVIDQFQRRGGRQYQQFLESLTRLSSVVYQNDRFYDPVRAEHRQVSFGFFSFSLPTDPDSSRAWRISWNPLFFEFVMAAAGGLRFDLGTYRPLEPASRRLFLLLSKIFRRRAVSPRFALHNLACDVLGFATTVSVADLKKKVRRCVERLVDHEIVSPISADKLFEKQGVGDYLVTVERGRYFDTSLTQTTPNVADSALYESLSSLGLDAATVLRLIKQYSVSVLQEWVDITLAARERFSESFFRKSAAAYFIDNVREATESGRRPPDWWLDLRKAEIRAQADQHRAGRVQATCAPSSPITPDGEQFKRVRDELFREFVASGQDRSRAGANADKFAAEHLRRSAQPRGADQLATLRPLVSLVGARSSS